MKIKIYEEAVVEDKELTFELKLFKVGSLIVVGLADEKGQRINNTSLVAFNKDMIMSRCATVSDSQGLPLDDMSRLEVENVSDDDNNYDW